MKLKQIEQELKLIASGIRYLKEEIEKLEQEYDYWLLQKCNILCKNSIKRNGKDEHINR